METSILLADDHIMISIGLRRSLKYNFGYTDVFSVTSCSDVMSELKKKTYTHAIFDLGLSDGSALEILPTIQSLYPELRKMIFSCKPAAAYNKALKQFGIHGYVSKEQGEEEITNALRKFFHNEALSPWTEDLFNNPFAILSPREMEVLHYLIKGLGTNEISTTLNIRANTCSTYKYRIMEKIGCKSEKELIELAEAYNV